MTIKKPVRMMAIDPSLNNIGVSAIDITNGKILISETIVFKPKDKEEFLKVFHEEGFTDVNKLAKGVDKVKRDRINRGWVNKRLLKVFQYVSDQIVDKEIDVLIVENQFHPELMYMVATFGLLTAQHKIHYMDYYPKNWKKILTGNGDISEGALENLVINVCGLPKGISEHQVDAFAILLTYLKEKNITVKGLRQDIIPC